MLSSDKKEALERRMSDLGIYEDDLIEKFIQGTGSGGQKVNKTSSCVFLQHPPSNLQVKVQRERSREMNRFLAREELCDQIEAIAQARKSARKQAREKTRRQKRRPSLRARARNVERKRQHGQKKENRRKPGPTD